MPTEARWKLAIAYRVVPLPENSLPGPKCQLAFAIAEGVPIAEWASKNNIPRRTAFRWATQPKVRARIALYRRCNLDQALGVLSNRVGRAAEKISELGENAVSESVKLAANRAVFSDMIAACKFSTLEERLTELEERLDERADRTRRTG